MSCLVFSSSGAVGEHLPAELLKCVVDPRRELFAPLGDLRVGLGVHHMCHEIAPMAAADDCRGM